jgi:transposase
MQQRTQDKAIEGEIEPAEGSIQPAMPPAPELPLPLPDITIPVPARSRTTLTQAKVERYLEAIALGATRGLAAAYAGMGVAAMKGWIDRIPELAEAVEACEAIAAMKWLNAIEKAAEAGQWQAAAWKLERLYPDLYGRRDTREHTGPGGGPILVSTPQVQQQKASLIEEWRQQRQSSNQLSTSPPPPSQDSS